MVEYPPHFFTATIKDWKRLLMPDKYKDIILESLRFQVKAKRGKIYGFVIMPNHIHIIWQILENHKRENVQRDFLKFTSQKIKYDLKENHPQVLESFRVNLADREFQFWQYRPLSIELYSENVFEQKLDYIHFNPCAKKWNLAILPEHYFYSSAALYSGENTHADILTNHKS